MDIRPGLSNAFILSLSYFTILLFASRGLTLEASCDIQGPDNMKVGLQLRCDLAKHR
jgi:hypothetical protein